jgi:hypothetical protein
MDNRSFFVQSEGRYIPTDSQAQSFLTLNFTQKNSLGVGTGTVIPTANPDNPGAIVNIQVQDLWGSVGAGANAPIYRLTSVGIGTSNPSETLHVQGNARITGAIYDSQNSAGTSGQVLKSTITGTRWTTANPDGTLEPFRISNNDSDITISTGNTITVTTNSVGIVTFTQSAVTLATTGIVQQLFENINLSSTQLTGTINLDILTGSLFYYTANATGNWTFNIRGNSSATLNSILPIGKSATVTILSTQGGSPTYANGFNIDGTSVSPKWVGGTAPSSGYANSINAYTYTILKTADSTYTVIGSLSKFS